MNIFSNELILGLKYAAHKFPRGLLTGSCPSSWVSSSTTRASSSSKPKRPQSMNNTRQEAPIGQSIASATQPVHSPMITFDTRDQFTTDDIQELNEQLEKNLLPPDNGSRLSRPQSSASKQSSRLSVASARSNLSNVSDKAWKP